MHTHRRVLWVLAATLLAACASSPERETAEPTPYRPYEEPSPGADRVVLHTGNQAVLDLWRQAEAARAAGDYDAAIAAIERALRIEPDNAAMWSRLAELHLRKQNANQAESLAAKSNALAAENRLLLYRNWLIIARARRLKGDDIGAQEAEYTAQTLKP
ncbi:MAG: hypothetical protein KatS3mg121_0248 [Gammaproteobacteria bacterium]|nr:MAG: hypothetical protein KatS3mg121_0248 [Gammaproteobacteria bacterium]